MRVVALCGPPCAGKTTLARRLAEPGDVVLDFDDIARAMGSPTLRLHPEPFRAMAEQTIQTRLANATATDTGGTDMPASCTHHTSTCWHR